MVKDKVTIQETVDFLNGLLKIDQAAITALFSLRTACNKELADHETVQVGLIGKHYFQVGLIGVLNGLFGIDDNGWGHIAADYEDGKIIGWRLLTEDEIKGFTKEEG